MPPELLTSHDAPGAAGVKRQNIKLIRLIFNAEPLEPARVAPARHYTVNATVTFGAASRAGRSIKVTGTAAPVGGNHYL